MVKKTDENEIFELKKQEYGFRRNNNAFLIINDYKTQQYIEDQRKREDIEK